jgi:hypothetical protein
MLFARTPKFNGNLNAFLYKTLSGFCFGFGIYFSQGASATLGFVLQHLRCDEDLKYSLLILGAAQK